MLLMSNIYGLKPVWFVSVCLFFKTECDVSFSSFLSSVMLWCLIVTVLPCYEALPHNFDFPVKIEKFEED
jgi:hypothetical protein